jgi:exonuclease VII small subunit
MDMSDNRSKTVPEAIVGQLVSRSAYDEALNAIVAGDKMLEAAIARAEKAEAMAREAQTARDASEAYIKAITKERDDAVADSERNHRREVAAHKAGVEAEHVANSLLAETYDYVGTKKLGDMGPRIRAHLDDAPAGVAAPRRGDMLAEALHKMRVDLDAATARAEKAEARERKIGEELDKATGMVEGLVAENTRFRHAAAETADLLMREAMGDKP